MSVVPKPNGALGFVRSKNHLRTETYCCKCKLQVTTQGDYRLQAATEKCTECEMFIHETCKNKTHRCFPVSSMGGLNIHDCKCGRTQCFAECLNNWFKIVQ